MSIGKAVWTSVVWTARILLYPVHSTSRLLARLMLIAAAIAPIVGLIVLGGWFWQELLDWTRFLVDGSLLPAAAAFLIAVGLFSYVLKVMGQVVVIAFKFVGKTIMDALRGSWHPGWEVTRSFAHTWRRYVVEVPRTALQTFKSACLIALMVFGFGLLLWAAYPLTEPRMVDRYVVVVDANDGRAEEPVKKEIKVHLRTRTVFSLTYLNNAQPQEGVGVCLEEGHKEWLRMFREAIVECVQLERSRSGIVEGSTPGDLPEFKVVGFASVAPMQSGDHDAAELNCDIANRRADAVGSFLAGENKWSCDTIGNDFKSARKLCAGESKVYDGDTHRVRVHQWSDPKRMQGKKPADDGALPNERRYRVELLNRAVHITVPEDFCQAPDSTTPQKVVSQ